MTTKDLKPECLDDSGSKPRRVFRKESVCNVPLSYDCPSLSNSTAELHLSHTNQLGHVESKQSNKENDSINTFQPLCTIPLFDHHDKVKLLFMAAKNQSVDIIKSLVRAGVKLSATDQYGHTALHWTVLQDRSRVIQKQKVVINLDIMVDIVRTLLHNGAYVNATTNNGNTALHFAVNFGYTEVVAALLDHGADMHGLVGMHIRHAITRECFSVEDRMSFVSSMAEVVYSGSDGPWRDPQSTILHIAVRHMHTEIVIDLLKRGAKVDAIQHDGKTPLMLTVGTNSYSCEKVVGLLLDYGANINLRNTDGMTPLHYASRNNTSAVVKMLIIRGAKVGSVNSCGKTPLAIAVEEGYVEVVEVLLENEGDIDRKDSCGMTILHLACAMARGDVVALLLEGGADVNITCDDGRVPYEIALATERNCWKKKQTHLDCSKREILCAGTTLLWRTYEHRQCTCVLQLLQVYINMMVYLGVPLHPHNINGRTSNVSYSEQRVREVVERFKNTRISSCNNITIKNILEDNKDPVYVLNECVMKEMSKVLCELKLGVLERDMINVLKYATRKGKLRAKLLNSGQDWLLHIISLSGNQLPLLPKEVNRKILSYLHEAELNLAMGTV